jgi:alkanesulfonate monooxygenase SsuD/methylene tetrahydromethanopterin reductase-like flavin-dependent oxidoreductase (luciferase family)
MKIGILYQGPSGERLSTTARLIESLGFDSFWVGDHVLAYVDGVTAVGMAGAATDRIIVGTAVCLVPFRNPVLLSRSVSTIACDIGDRLVLGVGVGGDMPDEFGSVGVECDSRPAALESAFTTLHDALDRGIVGAYEFRDRPTGGCPPIWSGGRSMSAARRAARLADGYVPYLVTPQHYARLAGAVRTVRASEVRNELPFTWACCAMVSINENPELARRAALDYRPFGLRDDQIDTYVIHGDADRCVDGLQAFGEVGVEHLVLHITATPNEYRYQLERLAAILDRLRTIPTARAQTVRGELAR